MNKQRIIALALAGVLAISLLASCSSNDADNQDDLVDEETTLTPDMDEDADMDMDADLEEDFFDEEAFNNPNAGMGSPEDDLDMGMGGDMDMPTVDDDGQNEAPPATTTPSVVPEPEPVPDSTTTPSVDAMSKVEAVWTDIEAAVELPGFGDIEVDILEAVYGVDSAHLEEFICKIPMINVQATEFFIAKVTSGNMDAVKAACESRQAALAAEWSNYLPEQLDLVKDYRLVVNGDYIFFGIGYDMDACVAIFNSYTK